MPLLSICIPTYNRANYLRKSLRSITSQAIFSSTDDIEIIISDNCSSDATESVSMEFVTAYPGKIKYFRNQTNVHDKNFELALRRGSGEYRKLYNDTLVMRENILNDLVAFINAHFADKPILFFSNQSAKNKIEKCKDLNDFIQCVSYLSTWIGGFGLWKEQIKIFDEIPEDFFKLHLAQVYILCLLISSGSKAFIYNDHIVFPERIGGKSGYNIAEVFGQNYFYILKHFVKNGYIDNSIYTKEKKKTLYGQIIPQYFDFKCRYNFKKTGYVKYLHECYGHLFFYLSFLYISYKYTENIIKIIFSTKKTRMKKLWKAFFRGCEIFPDDFSSLKKEDLSKIMLGRGGSGKLRVTFTDDREEMLIIGNNVFIADGVNFIFKTRNELEHTCLRDYRKKSIIIDDNVNIETDCTIFPGTNICDGVTIESGSTVCGVVQY